jgi:hypothetical protein
MQKTITILALLLTAYLLFSCNAAKKLDKIHNRAPITTAGKCAAWYEPVASTKTIIEVVKGKPDTVIKDGPVQYAWVDCDSAVKTASHTVRVPYALWRTEFISITDTLKIHDTSTVINKAAETALQLRTDKAEQKLAVRTKQVKIVMWWALIATALIAIFITIKLIK